MRLNNNAMGVALVGAIASLPRVAAWGVAGHEIVATIAQIHLHPSTVEQLCAILPPYANCHLAPVAAWADKVRFHMPWSGPLHYVGGVGDHPSDHCDFGDDGWQGTPGHNVLGAVRNTTMWLEKGYEGAEEALKFLVHFIGDLHQPLHLTGRDRGGNSVKVRFDRRITNLHSVWDSRLIAKSLRTIPQNYTYPLPSRQIESALRGTIYDPYVRQIMYEGVLGRFRDAIDEWTVCPLPELSTRPYPLTEKLEQLPVRGGFFDAVRSSLSSWMRPRKPVEEAPPTDDEIICPHAWAAPMHQLNCDIIWPAELDDPNYQAQIATQGYLELDTPKYAGRIKDEWLVEELLAMGGIRLAATLNYLFAREETAVSPLYKLY
ncbi:phospholipase C/P1 nuclease [Schizopora paradoxa]|uniref:Phospholipase C/P1 nuclease n=1 Tax=Schizopora paradoxa TaxID=27342 RepID=A0A0H2RX63_9AGAM|nr:phospholipase C/P1 nuclease [Schizopora paradoxa]